MQEKMKMTKQEDKDLVQVQQNCSLYFCLKIIFKSLCLWLIWPFKCLILMILTMAIYHENLLKDSLISLFFMVKLFSLLETKMILKMPNETFLRITRYNHFVDIGCNALDSCLPVGMFVKKVLNIIYSEEDDGLIGRWQRNGGGGGGRRSEQIRELKFRFIPCQINKKCRINGIRCA